MTSASPGGALATAVRDVLRHQVPEHVLQDPVQQKMMRGLTDQFLDSVSGLDRSGDRVDEMDAATFAAALVVGWMMAD